MITFAYDPQDSALAERLTHDLQKQGLSISQTLSTAKDNALVMLSSPAGNQNKTVQDLINQAYDNGQHVIVVMAQTAPTSKLIDHLKVFDFTSAYPLDALVPQLKLVTSGKAGLPLKVLTPKARKQNQSIGLWLTIIVLASFIGGLVLVGFFRIQAPVEEYNSVNTEIAVTVAAIIQPNLPHSTEEAANFPATVQAVPTAQRPLLIQTATALVAPKPTKSY